MEIRKVFDDDVYAQIRQLPEWLSGQSAWIEHIPFAFAIVHILRPRTLVELGTHAGDSYLAFCQAARELDFPTSCFAIDTWRGDFHAGFYAEEVFDRLREYHDPRYGRFSRLLRMSFDEALPRFENGSIDLLHIDGFHTYEAVRHDFFSWLPKLGTRGVVLFHDTAERKEGFGVWRLWEELRSEYPHFEFRHGHGLGVLGTGTELPEPFRRLVGLQDPQAERLRTCFSRLGKRVVWKSKGKPAWRWHLKQLRYRVPDLGDWFRSPRT